MRQTSVWWMAFAGCAFPVTGYAAPFTPGNLLVTLNEQLIEYRVDGTRVQTLDIPYPGGRPGSEFARDVIVDRDGRAVVLNGTWEPVVSVYDPELNAWGHHGHPEWGVVANVSFGGLDLYGDFVFVTDQDFEGGVGAMRFDTANQRQAVAFGETWQGYIDLTVGLDGLVYALDGDEVTVDVFDPVSLAFERRITLAAAVRALGANADGDLFGASWDGSIVRFDETGALVDLLASGTSNLTDLNVDPTGRIVVSGRFGEVILTNEAFDGVHSFDAGGLVTFACVVPECVTLSATTLVAGRPAIITVTNARPGSMVVVAFSDRAARPTPLAFGPFCGMSELGPSAGVRVACAGRADAFGHLRCELTTPDLAGQRVVFQAIEAGSCPESCDSRPILRTIVADG